ncbi:mucoidy inhibitor MuiA family protein [Marinobacter caseinilyticus]|uniref:mucoidy inhibitor MuiA family protein n=1 Tax=Marinobacter caseinilyticus TaxID=2692195 RepID=UPI00140973D0|nr:mucoidy inhibitor MuiA family protein [Marinobacter caseinilyticus]
MRFPLNRALKMVVAVALWMPLPSIAGITEVVLFPDQATVTRAESRAVTAGGGQLTIPDLPAGLIDSSLRVSLSGKGVALGQTSLHTEQRANPVAERIISLEAALLSVVDDLQVLDDDIRAAQYRLTLLDNLTTRPGDTLNAADINTTADTIHQQARDALASIRRVGIQKRDLLKERSRLERELAAIQHSAKAVKHLTLTYQAAAASDVVVSVTYQTRQAGWDSQYDARLDTEAGTLDLSHLAVIHQNTGEDWTGVALWLSTANTDAGGQLPELSSWFVAPRQPAMAPRQREAASIAMESDAFNKGATQPQTANLEQAGLSQRFRIPGTVTIHDGSRQRRLSVAHYPLAADVSTHMVPALSSRGYIHASAQYDGAVTLPAAPVWLYQDNQFTGHSRLAQVQPNETLALAFGVDDKVSVAITRDADQRGEKGLINGEKYLQRLNRYTIANNHPQPVKLRVLDRLPVSRNDDITITYQSISTPVQENVDDNQGVIAWDRLLQAGQTLVLSAGFELRVPEEQELPWLP